MNTPPRSAGQSGIRSPFRSILSTLLSLCAVWLLSTDPVSRVLAVHAHVAPQSSRPAPQSAPRIPETLERRLSVSGVRAIFHAGAVT